MTQDINIIKSILDASNRGLDIITDCCPTAAEVANNPKKAFRLRSDERTPSAYLYPPKDSGDCWHVKDYGMSDGSGYFSPIDLYMRERGYVKSQFSLALHELMEEYGVTEELSTKVNRPKIERRPAKEEEMGLSPRVKFRDGFTVEDYAVWGPRVSAEHLTELGWGAVDSVSTTKGGEVITKSATPTFPIYAQTCSYLNSNGEQCSFMKLYEPKNPNKAFRFSIVGEKPKHYIFGLGALRRKFEERREEKLDEVVLVSGGSDAINCLSMGYQPVWLGSETEELGEEDLHLLLNYAKRVINIPDIDSTGIKMGIRLALRLPRLYTAWLTPKDVGELHDNRGRKRKDLKDYIQLSPNQKSMQQLINRALCAQYWECHKNKQQPERNEYSISRTRLDYFLWLNGFATLADDQQTEPLYIHVKNNVVKSIKAKHITSFISKWMEDRGLDESLRDKVLRSHDLPNNQSSTLRVRDDLDFTHATASTQCFFFRNGWVDITKDDCIFHRYSELVDRYVWNEQIIQHDFRKMPKMFTIEQHKDGTYSVRTDGNVPSKLFQVVINSSRIYWRKEEEEGQELTEAELAEEQQSLVSKMAAIGYMLHRFKSESEAWAIICQDSTLGEGEDECNGRSGKSFFLKAVSCMLNTFPLEARTSSITENRFIFDGVTKGTDLIVIDECHKNLNYDFFFGKITGDLRYEEKGNHPRLIPFVQSPKFAFATNYVLRHHDPSTDGRLWPQIFSDFYHVQTKTNNYNETRTIRDDFKQNLMGSNYPEEDWQADIAFMLQCLQFYLSLPAGERRIMPPMTRIEKREQLANVGKDFKQWADEFFSEDSGNLDIKMKQIDVLSSYNAEASYQMKMQGFTKKLKEYCAFAEHIHCLNPMSITGKKKDGDRWTERVEGRQMQFYYVQSKKAAAAKVIESETQQTEFDF